MGVSREAEEGIFDCLECGLHRYGMARFQNVECEAHDGCLVIRLFLDILNESIGIFVLVRPDWSESLGKEVQ